ncbi:MAG: SGNH/GDSL hydrolase family protein [Mycobacteriaceae bacterium]|nr:SGNH/GDSL hydrolase family protein [Mycobacteriaceae bacterium]
MKRLPAGCAAIAAIAAVLIPPAPAGATPAPGGYRHYVALGDSFAAAPLVPTQNGGSPICLQSVDNGYPAQLANRLGIRSFRNATCSGAKAQELGTPGPAWGRGVTPQYQALSLDTDLVTVTIGANDAGLFTDLMSCVSLQPGRGCVDRFTAGGADRLARKVEAAGAAVGVALAEIHRRAPRARIVVTSYGKYLRPGGCPTLAAPIQPRDADYLQATVDRLGDLIAAQAAAHQAAFVDLRTASRGHDSCAAADVRWIEPAIPAAPAAPFHPNARGGAAYAALIAAALQPA